MVYDAHSRAACIGYVVLDLSELSAISPADYIPSDNYDLTIFDGFAPDERPGGSLIFFDAVPAFTDVNVTGDIANPPVLAIESDHPAMRFLNPSNIAHAITRHLLVVSGADRTPDGGRSVREWR